MNKFALTPSELFEEIPEELAPYFGKANFAWEIVPQIKDIIVSILSSCSNKYKLLDHDVLIGKNVKIDRLATINGPAIIGDNVEIRPGAYIRGNVYIGEECVIGNSTELKNCILLKHVQVPHYNYVGDSILGNYSHMGAGSICSNLRSDGKEVIVHADKDYPSGLRKLGSILGDRADIGCGSVLNPGTIIGKNTQVYPLTMTRGAYPGDSIVKSTNEVVKKR